MILSKDCNTSGDIIVSSGFAASALAGEILYKYSPFWNCTKWVGLAIEIASYAGFPAYLLAVNRLDKYSIFINDCATLNSSDIYANFNKEQFEIVYKMTIPWAAPIGFLYFCLPGQKEIIIKSWNKYKELIIIIVGLVSFLRALYDYYY